MRAVVDLVDSIAGTWTRTVRLLVLGGIAVVALIMLMVTFTAPKVAETVGDRAERISDKAIQAAREETRNQSLAEEGWGYSDANAAAAASSAADTGDTYDSSYGEPEADWGEASE